MPHRMDPDHRGKGGLCRIARLCDCGFVFFNKKVLLQPQITPPSTRKGSQTSTFPAPLPPPSRHPFLESLASQSCIFLSSSRRDDLGSLTMLLILCKTMLQMATRTLLVAASCSPPSCSTALQNCVRTSMVSAMVEGAVLLTGLAEDPFQGANVLTSMHPEMDGGGKSLAAIYWKILREKERGAHLHRLAC